MQVLLPYSQGALLDEVHKMGKVTDTAYTETGTLVTANVPRCLVGKLQPYATADSISSGVWLDLGVGDEEEDVELVELVDLVEEAGNWKQQQPEVTLSDSLVASGRSSRGGSSSNNSLSSM